MDSAQRAYTLADIDSMRKAVMEIYPQDGWKGSYCYEVEQMRALYVQSTEALLRTYMEGGVGPEELADYAAKVVSERARHSCAPGSACAETHR